MPRVSLHAQIEIALVALLLLGSCSSGSDVFEHNLSDEERDEVADIAADVAYDTVLEHEKINELESRLEEVERRLSM
jgi:hypothetical protein